MAAGDEASKQQVAAAPGAVEGLVRLLSSSSYNLQLQAAIAVYGLAAGSDGLKQQVAAAPGAVDALVKLLSNSSSSSREELQYAAAAAVWQLAAGSHNIKQQLLAAPGAVASLAQLLLSSSKEVQEAAAGAVCELASSDDAHSASQLAAGSLALQQHLASAPAAVQGLMQLLSSSRSSSSSSATVRRAAARLLSAAAAAAHAMLQDTLQKFTGAAAVAVPVSGSSTGMQLAAAGAVQQLNAGGDINHAAQQVAAAMAGAIQGLMQLSSIECAQPGSAAVVPAGEGMRFLADSAAHSLTATCLQSCCHSGWQLCTCARRCYVT
jgi:hypothetical protein